MVGVAHQPVCHAHGPDDASRDASAARAYARLDVASVAGSPGAPGVEWRGDCAVCLLPARCDVPFGWRDKTAAGDLTPAYCARTGALLFGCGHAFHAACALEWLGRGTSTCPVCREAVPPPLGRRQASERPDATLDLREVPTPFAALKRTLAARGPQVATLRLGPGTRLHRRVVKWVAASCPRLETLELSHICIKLTHLSRLLDGCPRLRALHLPFCDSLTDAHLAVVARFPGLELLNVEGCDSLTDAGLEALARGAPALRTLRLAWCRRLGLKDPEALLRVAEGRQLASLSLRGTAFGARTIEAVVERCAGTLESLDVVACAVSARDSDRLACGVARRCPRSKHVLTDTIVLNSRKAVEDLLSRLVL